MKNLPGKENLLKIWRTIRPWVTFAALFLLLRFTGALSGISFVTGSALLKTGALDARTEAPAVAKTFDYDFKVRDLHGNIIDFNQFKGKTIFLNLWATWCGPCRVEMPAIDELYKKMKDNDKVVFVMLSLDKSEHFSKVVNFVNDKGYSFPVFVPSGYLPKPLQVPSIPTTLVVNAEGKIVTKETGTTNFDTPKFKKFLETL
ncbi:TlpA family protein disulfide reductase [Chryseolinea lacunae]|uniref:TlpA family protein disulfide reductase n=1 Tax=Chryseolinea lacunae TaxID=2801331 RepID=A0ABS1L160_9BACT|nr:TlpA disulfide reductase family protein [Chryseolinea lacunae]MBL0745439.1 TlpA family protein disulfide reductase [Chryseolinea lacunae]